MSSPKYITLHDVYGVSQRAFDRGQRGHELFVRYDAIDTMRPYDDGIVRCIVGIGGSYHHVSETREEIMGLIADITSVGGYIRD